MATLPDIAISQQINKTTEARILETKFGDGYGQRAQDGINAITDSWSLSWDVGSTNADILTDFFETRGGWDSFDWTPSGESVSKKWTCKSWSKTPTGYDVWSIKATIKQEFDLD